MSHPPAGLPVLTYHSIGESRSPTSTPRAWFAETLAALRDANFRAVDLDDWVARGRPDEPRGFAIAFDDGLRSVLAAADDLAAHDVPATVFLVTDRVGLDNAWPGQPAFVDREPLLTWREVEDLASVGLRFAAHGRTHARLDRLDDAQLTAELRGSRDAIGQRLGRASRLVAFPYGLSSPRVEREAARWFTAGFSTRLDYSSRSQQPFRLARIDAYYLRTRESLTRFVEGEWGGQLRVLRTLRGVKRLVLRPLPTSVGSLRTERTTS